MASPDKRRGRPVRLVAFDLDGTIFGRPTVPEVTPRLERAFMAAHERGVVLVAATGRPAWMLGEELLEAPWLDGAISANGARVVPLGRLTETAGVIETPVPRALALELLDYLDASGGIVNAHLNCRSVIAHWFDRPLPEFAQRLAEGDAALAETMFKRNPIFERYADGIVDEVESTAAVLRSDPALRLNKVDATFRTPADCERHLSAIEQMGPLEIARVGAADLEITAAGVTKGSALGRLCAALGIDEGQAAAFGDSANDLSMAGRAATFVAMGNATDEVKAAANEVCPSVRDDGVAVWIEEHVL